MKKTMLIIGFATVLSLVSCNNSNETILENDLKDVAQDLSSDKGAIAEDPYEQNQIAENSALLLDIWWIADEEHGGSDQFFNKDGTYDTDFGTLGTWEWVTEGKKIKVIDNGKEAILEVIELTANKFKFRYNDFTYTYYPKQK